MTGRKGPLDGKRVLITGATGSLGHALVRRIVSGTLGHPSKVVLFSRDEMKQHVMRLRFKHIEAATEQIIFGELGEYLEFRIGDIRDPDSVASVLRGVDVVFHGAAMKQVPTCEYFPDEAVRTNVTGAKNLVDAIRAQPSPVESVVFVSTDKACKPVNVMGMTKAIQERVFVEANLLCPETRFVGVRYGNVLSSRGSVIPLFALQVESGGPVTVTSEAMSRFLLTLDQAVDAVVASLEEAAPGEIFVPKVRSALILDVARAMIGDRDVEIVFTGIRPGEKVHEILVSDEETRRTTESGSGYFVIRPMLPELAKDDTPALALDREYGSGNDPMDPASVARFIREHLTEDPFVAP